jgi:bla regulator protein BlaR1
MIPKSISEMWVALAPALGDHLLQSTLFAVAAGLLTLVLRKNHARVRYGLWLAASMKFLVPFSLLIGIGGHLAWTRSSPGTKAGLFFAMNEVGQPFTQPLLQASSTVLPSTVAPGLSHVVSALLAILWLCGVAVVSSTWYVRWRKISLAIREAVPLHEGREVEALRRMEHIGGMRRRIGMLLSSASLEPGVFGIVHPVLIWPKGISEHLGDLHLEAIVAHEMWHVRRRDNLAAAIHMVVEAIFWFHPLVWWLGARLVEERERACDEEVLEFGSARQVYAESILKTCEFCLESPLACVSGVTGADLKKRIVHIMTQRVACKLSFSRKLILGVVGLAAIVAPIAFGLLNATPAGAESQAENQTPSTFAHEEASIKAKQSGDNGVRMSIGPDGFTATGGTLQMLMQNAYGVQPFQIADAPSWVNSEKYDVEAKLDGSAAEKLQKLGPDQRKLETQQMLQALLAERFRLKFHRETRDLPVYALIIAKSGFKLHEAKTSEPGPEGAGLGGSRGSATAQRVPIALLVHLLSEQVGRTVVDRTGLTGNYDFTLKWSPDQGTPMFTGADGGQLPADAAQPDSSRPSIFTALQDQLGLELESQKSSVEMLVIDSVEKPSEN